MPLSASLSPAVIAIGVLGRCPEGSVRGTPGLASLPPPPPHTAARPPLTPLPHQSVCAGPGEKNSALAGGFNACQFGRLSPYYETYFAALNKDQYEDSLCGRCAAVRGTGGRATGKTVVVMIVDACATCSYGDLDFTTKVRGGCVQGTWGVRGLVDASLGRWHGCGQAAVQCNELSLLVLC